MSKIQDVARHAGVSPSTVSNVLNGRVDRMKKETLGRVEAAISLLNFRPSTSARQLKTGYTPLLGLLVPSLANPMYGFIAREVETYAQERYGYRVLIGNTYRDRDKEAAFFGDLMAHGVRGVIIISSLVDEQHFESAGKRGMVIVSYDRRATPDVISQIDHVTVNNFEAARMATAHLIESGHRRLVFATASGMTMSRHDKIAGFLAAVQSAGPSVTAQVLDGGQLLEYGDSVMSESGRALASRIAVDPQRPTAILAVNDLMALGLMAGFRDAGLNVPNDVSIIGMDGLFLSALSNPALTTVQLPVVEMAQAMVERVMSRLRDTATEATEQVFSATLIKRESVAPLLQPAIKNSYKTKVAPMKLRKANAVGE